MSRVLEFLEGLEVSDEECPASEEALLFGEWRGWGGGSAGQEVQHQERDNR